MYIDMDNTLLRFDKERWQQKLYPSIRKDKPWVSFLPSDAIILSRYSSEEEKRNKEKWLDHYFPNIGRILTPISKHLTVSAHHHFLLDDYHTNLLNWRKSGGIAIQYDNGTNHKHSKWFVHWYEDEEGIYLLDENNNPLMFYRKEN